MPWIAGAVIGSAVIGGLGSSKANKDAAASAREAERVSAEEAQKNRDWQEKMFEKQVGLADTAHQREMKDLAGAGLNPILAAKYGGSSVPSSGSGATGSGYQAPVQNTLASASSALQALPMMADTMSASKLKDGQAGLLKAQEENIRADTVLKGSSAKYTDTQKDNLLQEMQLWESRAKKLEAEMKMSIMDAVEKRGWFDYRSGIKPGADEKGWEQFFDAKLQAVVAEAGRLANEAQLAGLKIPEGMANAALWKDIGEAGAGVKQFGRMGLNAAKSLWLRAFRR